MLCQEGKPHHSPAKALCSLKGRQTSKLQTADRVLRVQIHSARIVARPHLSSGVLDLSTSTAHWISAAMSPDVASSILIDPSLCPVAAYIRPAR